jgi:uncharacterized membrane protein
MSVRARITAAVGVVAVAVVVVALFVYALVAAADAPRTGPDVTVELLQPYESSFVNLWVRGCVASGESVAFCRCAIDEYTKRLRPDEFETASAVAQSGGRVSELPDNVRTAVETVERDCR